MSANARFVFLPAISPSLSSMIAALRSRCPTAIVEGDDTALSVSFGACTMRIVDLRESWVNEEALELAARAPDAAQAAMRAATHRLELYDSGDADEDDAHYNDGLAVFEHFVEVDGAVGFDPVTGDFSVVTR